MGQVQKQHNPHRRKWGGLRQVALGESVRADMKEQVTHLPAKLGDFVISREVVMAIGPVVGEWEKSDCLNVQTTMRSILNEKEGFRYICPGLDIVVGAVPGGTGPSQDMRPVVAAVSGEGTELTYLDSAFSRLIQYANPRLFARDPYLRIN